MRATVLADLRDTALEDLTPAADLRREAPLRLQTEHFLAFA